MSKKNPGPKRPGRSANDRRYLRHAAELDRAAQQIVKQIGGVVEVRSPDGRVGVAIGPRVKSSNIQPLPRERPGRPARVDLALLRGVDVDRELLACLIEESWPTDGPEACAIRKKPAARRSRRAPDEIRQFMALVFCTHFKAKGATHDEAIAGAAEKVSRGIDAVRSWLKAGQRARDAEMALEYREFRKRFTINESLLKCMRGWGYGDGKADARGRFAGLDHVKQALKKQGIAEVARTSLKAKRERTPRS